MCEAFCYDELARDGVVGGVGLNGLVESCKERDEVGPFADIVKRGEGAFYEGEVLFELCVRVEGTFCLESPVDLGTFCSRGLPEVVGVGDAGSWACLG